MKLSPATPAAASVLLLSGFVGWSLAFIALYALLSFGCAFGWDGVALGPVSLNRAALLIAWTVSLAGLGAILLATARLFRADDRGAGAFLRSAGILLSALALAATAGNFFMVATLSTCL